MRCSRSLVDMWTALCAVAEENARTAGAHIAYAASLERALARAALQHVLSLEKLCQVGWGLRMHDGVCSWQPHPVLEHPNTACQHSTKTLWTAHV